MIKINNSTCVHDQNYFDVLKFENFLDPNDEFVKFKKIRVN